MKKLISFLLMLTLTLFSVGCDILNQSPSKLVELETYSNMTLDGTTSIEVKYEYYNDDVRNLYEFVIDDQETIGKIMTGLFNVELKDYPKHQLITFAIRLITVKQGENEFSINLACVSNANGNRYLCESQDVYAIIEKYIEDNLMK